MKENKGMECLNWTVDFSREAGKQFEKLKRSGSRPPIRDAIGTLMADLQKNGPQLPSWPNFGPLGKEHFHCHLRKGRPTYVACWRIVDKKTKQIEVYYVGSHEGAPY
jgi:hypothetical protein